MCGAPLGKPHRGVQQTPSPPITAGHGQPGSALPHSSGGRAGAAGQHRPGPAAPRRRRAGRARPAAAGPGRAGLGGSGPAANARSAGEASGMAPAATGGIPPTAPSLGLMADGLGNRSALDGEVPWVLSSHGLQTTTLTTKTDGNDGKAEHLEYIAFALVPVFFIMGLLGILICHILKKKGYRCTTEAEELEEEKIDEKIEMNETIHENSDTVGQIVNYIMKNEANADVLKAMVADSSVFEPESPLSPTSPESPMSPGTPLSPGVVPFRHNCKAHHFHTVGGVVEKDVCTRCSHKRWHLIKPAQKSKENRRSRIGEVTVLSVGRFRVTKVDHKSNSKERKSLMSVSGVESVNGEMPAKQDVSEAPATPAKQEMQERRSSD
ncbi:RELT-like protein 1 [Passer domesticus]|uniref:RELT-like protein 1 n=2 Tax=Passer TaxID=9159 RepID=UPI0030FE30A3